MKRALILAISSVVLGALPAAAADLGGRIPTKAPPMVAAFSWTGFYVGGNIGASLNDSRYNLDPTGCFLTGCGAGGVGGNAARTDAGKFNRAAFTGGGQIGYNWQFAPNWVFGLETDINYNGSNETTNVTIGLPFAAGSTFNYSLNQKLDWFGTGRARLGFLPADRVMVYGTGGFAYGHLTSSTGINFPTSGDSYSGSLTNTRLGWTAGGGVEWAFASNWTAKAEYLYMDLGSTSYTDGCLTACGAGPAFPSYQSTVNTREHIARIGINYLFNSGAPLVARY
jgi:outer membrane immunogenic protein